MVKYCVLCDNRDKTASYHKFPKDVQVRTKWLKFCNVDEAVLRTSTFYAPVILQKKTTFLQQQIKFKKIKAYHPFIILNVKNGV